MSGTFPADIEPRKRTITLEHFLSMSSGIDCDDSDDKSPGNESSMLDGDNPHYYELTLSLKTIRDPGTKAVYCSVQPNLAGGAIARAAGRPLTDLFDELVAEPLGIRRYCMNLSPLGEPYMGGGIRFTARDFAKFGQLYLDGGTWGGRHILDRSFIERASSPRHHDGHERLRSALVGDGVSIPRRHAPGLLRQRQWRAGGDRDPAAGHGRHRLRWELSGRDRRQDAA